MVELRIKRDPSPHSEGGADETLLELASVEIDAWYQCFYRWSRGLCSSSEANIRPVYDALARDFHVVLTNGEMMSRTEYWGRLLSLYAVRRGHPPSHIVNVNLRPIESDHVLVSLDLLKNGVPKKKVNSALMRRTSFAPGGIEWVHVHESAHELAVAPQLPAVQHPAGVFLRGEPPPSTH